MAECDLKDSWCISVALNVKGLEDRSGLEIVSLYTDIKLEPLSSEDALDKSAGGHCALHAPPANAFVAATDTAVCPAQKYSTEKIQQMEIV